MTIIILHKEIDKEQFEKLCALQCSRDEFLDWFEVSDKTLNAWCRRTYKASFSAVFAQKRGKGKISLRRHPTSTGGALTGEGGDVIILDDPQDPLMANSEAERAATISFFTNTLQSRLNDARTE